MTIKAAIFDMDGTILDTIEDLGNAINHTLAHFGYNRVFTPDEAKAFFCNGARAAVASALKAVDAPADDAAVDRVLQYYKPYYAAHGNIKTRPYPGILELLSMLSSSGIKTAVVSNKPDPAVQNLCSEYFPGMFDFSLGEVPGIRRKPEPDMVFACLKKLGVSPEEAIYIGDSEVDVQTARNSDLPCICVDWGFRTRDALTGADRIVSDCNELARAIIG
jgi:phosphoglycolate phosphatase